MCVASVVFAVSLWLILLLNHSYSYRTQRVQLFRVEGRLKVGGNGLNSWGRNDEAYNVRLLCRMIHQSEAINGTKAFKYSESHIEELIKERKIRVDRLNEESGLLPLRYSLRQGRREVALLLLRQGASAFASDGEGMVIKEVLHSTQPGHLHLLTDLLEGIAPSTAQALLDSEITSSSSSSSSGIQKYAIKYWLQRGLFHILPAPKLRALGVPRLDSLKYRIVGQSFALEHITSEVASNFVNSELTRKPLVLLFAGPPGHGKSETAKQLADLLGVAFHKVDCRNHAHPWEMFGSGAGYIGSDSGSQLGTFMSNEASGRRSVVLLDEFDHCQPETWEAFYHIFEEGEYTYKKVGAADTAQTKVLDCSKTIWLLTTNKFDNDIVHFNHMHSKSIAALKEGTHSFDNLNDKFEDFIRPKLRTFFRGGLTRRINAVVPFFSFDEEEAHVVTDMYVDKLRLMYSRPATKERLLGSLQFDVTNYATAELSRVYFRHKLDGATAIVREVNSRVVRNLLHMRWIRDEGPTEGTRSNFSWIHFNHESGGAYLVGDLTPKMMSLAPYFLRREAFANTVSKKQFMGEDQLTVDDWIDPFRKANYSAPVKVYDTGLSGALLNSFTDRSASEEGIIKRESSAPSINKVATLQYRAEALKDYVRNSSTEVRQSFDDNSTPSVSTAEEYDDRILILVTFEDSSSPIRISNLFSSNASISSALETIFTSLGMNSSLIRPWVLVSDFSEESAMEKTSHNFVGKRAIVCEMTDVVKGWRLIRDYSAPLSGLLSIGRNFEDEYDYRVLVLSLETALPISQYSSIPSIRWASDDSLNKWRKDLKVNDVVDVEVSVENSVSETEWREAVVLGSARLYDGEYSVDLRPLGALSTKENIQLRNSSPLIQPLYTRSRNWRRDIAVGHQLEVRITKDLWQRGDVVHIDHEMEEITLSVQSGSLLIQRKCPLYHEDLRLPRTMSETSLPELSGNSLRDFKSDDDYGDDD